MHICIHCRQECQPIIDTAGWGPEDFEPKDIDIVSDCCFGSYASYDDDYIEEFKQLIENEDYNEDELSDDDELLIAVIANEV